MDAFDPSLASGSVIRVPIGDVVDLLSVTHAPDRGDRFPPIAVIHLAGRFLVADGYISRIRSDPKGAEHLFLTTLHHRKRVAVSLCTRATGSA